MLFKLVQAWSGLFRAVWGGGCPGLFRVAQDCPGLRRAVDGDLGLFRLV